jgi:MYXO-CTERM domain-containing protein
MKHLISLLALSSTLLVLAPRAEADVRKPNLRFEVDATMADIRAPQQHDSNVIFLNRCIGGCVIQPGFDDSRTNTSSVVAGTHGTTAFISEYNRSEEEWQQLMDCVKRTYEPFDIVITDVDPGNQPHFEAIVAGTDDEISTEAAGIAPASCGVVNNAITFNFANQAQGVDDLCWTVAQETAHAFGLDHEFDCQDPMTYLTDCGFKKVFQNRNIACGEYEARSCSCGGSTQNSYQRILSEFGQGQLTPPTVGINRPADGATVRPHFPFEVAAEDNIEVSLVEFAIDGQVVATLDSPPFVINAPDGLSGTVVLEARATDNVGSSTTSSSITVTIDDTLVDFGGECGDDNDCASNLCAKNAAGEGTCTTFCSGEDDDSCAGGTACVPAGDRFVCYPDSSSSGGCNSSGGDGSGALAFVMLGLAAVFGRRRRRE